VAAENSERAVRRLAAILAADVAGYSRLMGSDEEGTVTALKALRVSLIDPKVKEHRGHTVKTTGDGALVEFGSAVDAARCALEIQRAMAERNADIPADRRIEFRIGINVGDVIFDEGDIYGDGVNVAARVQELARPGTICFSSHAYQQIEGKVAIDVRDLGDQQLKNIARPVRVYGVGLDSTAARPELALPERPSIAVLPFNNMSGDAEQEYFADGMAEDILTALSRCNWLFVIARNSSFTYKGRTVDVRQIGRELGVRYVLEGSVRRSGNRLRFTAQLVEAASGSHIWADRFDGETSDVFDLQDRITESVVGAIEPSLQMAEIERLRRKPAASLDAYDLLLRAQQLEYEFTEQSLAEALKCLERALAIDPGYAPAMALAAYCMAERAYQGWTRDLSAETAEGLRLAGRAVELGKDNANVLWMAAFAVWQLGRDPQRSRELFHRSLLVNPNCAVALTILGWIEGFLGDHTLSVELIARAQRLSPRDPRGWLMSVGMALTLLVAGKFQEALTWAEKALVQNRRSATALRVMAVALVNLGQQDKAEMIVGEILKIDPQLTISSLRGRVPLITDAVWKMYSEALRRAGLPE
jgi:TolB-like protein/class 3 adenylate cyclase/tetratricopeptide (TPR) repeat protein